MLTAHIRVCAKHPMREVESEVRRLREATRAAVERMKCSQGKADAEAQSHPNAEQAQYCDGTSHGLRTAMSMLQEEHDKSGVRPAVTHVAAHQDSLYVKWSDGTVWRWWRGGERWECENGPLGLVGIEWVPL